MAILIGGEKAYLKRHIQGFIVSYQWLDNEPAMFIARDDRFANENRPTVVVRLDDAYRYTDNKNNPTPELFDYTFKSAEYLGFLGDYEINNASYKIATIILDGIPDLLEMPPEPTQMTKEQGAEIGEMIVKVDGKTIAHKEITVPESLSA